MDLDVPLGKSKEVLDDYRLRVGLPTLKLCLEYAQELIVMGHLGRPQGKEVPELSVAPIARWLEEQGLAAEIESGKLKLLENLRFEAGEDGCDPGYARDLASLGDFFVNEAFAAHHPAASTTVLPTLLPHSAGLRFAQEVEVLTRVRNYPKRPLIAIIGGVKIEDKLRAVRVLSEVADVVLVGGKIASEIKKKPGLVKELGEGVVLGELNKDQTDLTPETLQVWREILLHHAGMIIWNGPIGKIEGQVSSIKYQGEEEKLGSGRGTYKVAQAIIESGVESIVGGGDTVGFLEKLGMTEDFNFVSTGGGAMLKFLTEGTLPTVKALD